jgi:hypothetical protein
VFPTGDADTGFVQHILPSNRDGASSREEMD